MTIRETFAANLRDARNRLGLSQEDLAHLADIDRTYVSSLERCLYAASIDMVDKLAGVLETDAAALLRPLPEDYVAKKPRSGRKPKR